MPLSAQSLQLFESFTDHAVLQRDAPHPFWGWAKPRRTVKVTMGETVLKTKADKSGRWEVQLPATAAGGPHEIRVTAGRETLVCSDIYFGDVYLLSGQSNMEWQLRQSDAGGSRAKAIADPLIRELKVAKSHANDPQKHLEIDQNYGTDWMVGTAEEIGKFSGVGSYFAHYLREEMDVPIGLLHSSWGGSRIEPWMSPAALGVDAAKLQAQRQGASSAAGAEGRAAFARYFPGRELPTKDEGEAMGWLSADFDASTWPTMTLPTFWEAAGYPSVDGYFYYRKNFRLTAAQAAGKATLHLGAIDDGDWTYLNGQEVGSTPNAYSEKRIYQVPKGVLRAGENVIAIRVYDGGGGGGFSAGAEKFYLETAAGKVSLAGDFHYNIGEFRVDFRPNQVPTILYNAMIAPLEGYPLKGILWYQGESNAGQGDNVKYADLFKGMIRQWRGFFKNDKLPFYWVQLANFRAPPTTPNEPGWAVLRQSQTAALELPLTGQAVITDIGEADDIHPRNKWEVGRRLSLHARKDIYGQSIQAASPRVSSANMMSGHVLLRFSDIGNGLMVKSAERYGYLKGFTLQDSAGNWRFAQAVFDPKQNTVLVFNPAGTGIRSVRYAWTDNPTDANLFSKGGLPVTPFEIEVKE